MNDQIHSEPINRSNSRAISLRLAPGNLKIN